MKAKKYSSCRPKRQQKIRKSYSFIFAKAIAPHFFVGVPLLFVKKRDTLLGLIMFDNGGERGTSRSVCDGNTAGKKNPTESKV